MSKFVLDFPKVLDLESLDPKKTARFFDDVAHSAKLQPVNHQLGVHDPSIVWTIDNFLSPEECDHIIKTSETIGFSSVNGDEQSAGSYDAQYRDNDRLLVFDENHALIDMIESRLPARDWFEQLPSPYGFGSAGRSWRNTEKLNPCLRINRYQNSQTGFQWHRDAQYTQSDDVRSHSTLLIYLNDAPHGETCFMKPRKDVIHDGLTIDEELALLRDTGTDSVLLLPKQGTAVIFDQRLIHKAAPSKETKYVLRTDLLSESIDGAVDKSALETRIEELTKQLFRQAQYYELRLRADPTTQKALMKKTNELYEICLSLRQHPHRLTEFPTRLTHRLERIPMHGAETWRLRLLSRSGREYVFGSNVDFAQLSAAEILHFVRLASTYVITSSTEDYMFTQQPGNEETGKLLDDPQDFTTNLIRHMTNFPHTPYIVRECELPSDLHFPDDKESDNSGSDSDQSEDYEYCEDECRDVEISAKAFDKYLEAKYGDEMVWNERSKPDFVGLVSKLTCRKAMIHSTGCAWNCCPSGCIASHYVDVLNETHSLQSDKNAVIDVQVQSIKENVIRGTLVLCGYDAAHGNHASCNYEYYVKEHRNKTKYIHTEMRMQFFVNIAKSEIVILFTPKVTV